MCPLVWKARWIDNNPDLHKEPEEASSMRWGLIFESLAIGVARGGTPYFATPKENKSEYYPRVVAQAELCRQLLKDYGGKIVAKQKELKVTFEHNGVELNISGNLDVVYEMPNGTRIVIDLKSTADAENTFGQFSWGNPEKMDFTQIVHYELLHLLFYGILPFSQYWIFDFKKNGGHKLINVEITDFTRESHKDLLADVYSQIVSNIAVDDWTPQPIYNRCRVCPVPCDKQKKFPEFIHIIK